MQPQCSFTSSINEMNANYHTDNFSSVESLIRFTIYNTSPPGKMK